MILETWAAGLAMGVHAIGDEAFHQIASLAHELWERGEQGYLHIEHAQMARPDSVALLDPDQTYLHMQPCHFLSDRRWLKDKLGELYSHCFPWHLFEKRQIPVYFGSDSPIEKPSLFDNIRAVEAAGESGIKKFEKDFINYQSLPKRFTRTQGYSEFEQGKVSRVVLGGREVFIAH